MTAPSASFAEEGREVAVAATRDAVDSVVTVHHGQMPEIQMLDSEHARGCAHTLDRYQLMPTNIVAPPPMRPQKPSGCIVCVKGLAKVIPSHIVYRAVH